jgi:hypothetical protein
MKLMLFVSIALALFAVAIVVWLFRQWRRPKIQAGTGDQPTTEINESQIVISPFVMRLVILWEKPIFKKIRGRYCRVGFKRKFSNGTIETHHDAVIVGTGYKP